MVFKVLAIIAVLFIVYLLFFKKSRESTVNSNKKKKNQSIRDEMVECPSCGVYVSKNEGILSNGHFYCSKECLNNK
ncbi:MAG: PP0621 family protein [Campylobacterota bacterium]